jgi:hypothetical protein
MLNLIPFLVWLRLGRLGDLDQRFAIGPPCSLRGRPRSRGAFRIVIHEGSLTGRIGHNPAIAQGAYIERLPRLVSDVHICFKGGVRR